MNYEKDLKIDVESLDVEWADQPTLMFKYTKISAEARMELDEAKENLGVVKAEIDLQIREKPEKFGIVKLTEAAVQSAIILDEDFGKANKECMKAAYELEMAQGAVRAVDQRKQALENLVRLHGLQYFAGPKIPRDLSKEYNKKQVQKEADAKIKIRRTR